jgi:hypothetical protein
MAILPKVRILPACCVFFLLGMVPIAIAVCIQLVLNLLCSSVCFSCRVFFFRALCTSSLLFLYPVVFSPMSPPVCCC